MNMKRITILLVMITALSVAHAQQGLHINELFTGKIIPQERMMETRVRGKMIAKYQLSYFHSLRFNVNEQEMARVKELMDKDNEAHALDKEEFVKNAGKPQLTTYMMRLKPSNGNNRYLCYKATQHAGDKTKREMIVIYMEGQLSSLQTLKGILQETTK